MIFVEKFIALVQKKVVLVGGVSLIAFAAGTGSGYVYAKKKLTAEFETLLKEETERTRQFFKRQYKQGEFKTPGDAVEALIGEDATHISDQVAAAADALLSYQGSEEGGRVIKNLDLSRGEIRADPHSLSGPPNVVERNVFEPPPSRVNFVNPDEIAARDPRKPYVISDEEYLENEPGYSQHSVTYYEGDQVLADSQDKELPEHEIEMVFGDCYLRFGHMSNDNNIVYIRNEVLEMDFEVARSEGKYSVEVAGFTEEPPPYAVGRYRG